MAEPGAAGSAGSDQESQDQPQRGWVMRQPMRVFGPPDLGPEHRGHPLVGTKYDPALRRARRLQRKSDKRSDAG